MKKILVYISPEKYSSLFDLVLGYDGGADVVVPYADTNGEDLKDVVYSCVFTRGSTGRKNTAIFIGGPDVNKGEEFLQEIIKIFAGLPSEFRVSVVADPHGAHTASSACAIKIKKALKGKMKGLNATVLAGTGPVGQSISVLLANEGCNVTLTSRSIDRAKRVCELLKDKYYVQVKPFEASDEKTTEDAVLEADIVVTTGPEAVTLLSKKIWSNNTRIKVLADVNAVPPYGIEGTDARDDCRLIDGKISIGALTTGSLKIKCHHQVVRELFEEKGAIFGLERIYKIAEKVPH